MKRILNVMKMHGTTIKKKKFLGILIQKHPSVLQQILAPKTLDFVNSTGEAFAKNCRAVSVLIKSGCE